MSPQKHGWELRFWSMLSPETRQRLETHLARNPPVFEVERTIEEAQRRNSRCPFGIDGHRNCGCVQEAK